MSYEYEYTCLGSGFRETALNCEHKHSDRKPKFINYVSCSTSQVRFPIGGHFFPTMFLWMFWEKWNNKKNDLRLYSVQLSIKWFTANSEAPNTAYIRHCSDYIGRTIILLKPIPSFFRHIPLKRCNVSQTSMPRKGFESASSLFQPSKTGEYYDLRFVKEFKISMELGLQIT
jgi:hypothetical protein